MPKPFSCTWLMSLLRNFSLPARAPLALTGSVAAHFKVLRRSFPDSSSGDHSRPALQYHPPVCTPAELSFLLPSPGGTQCS